MIFLFFACSEELPTGYDAHEWLGEYETPQYINEELVQPYGLSAFQNGFLVMDRGSESLLYVEDQQVEVLVENIAANYFSEGNRLLLGGDDAIYSLDSVESPIALVDGLVAPSAITQVDAQLFWIEEGRVWEFDGTESSVLSEELPDAYDLLAWDDALWITTQADKSIWKYDLVNPPEKIVSLEDIPHRMAVGEDGLWLTTRSFRWPYAGWVVFFDGQTVQKISETPPEPEWILANGSQVIWSSKQSITSYREDPYDIRAIQTRVGSMLIQNDQLYWTDLQAGKIGVLSLD